MMKKIVLTQRETGRKMKMEKEGGSSEDWRRRKIMKRRRENEPWSLVTSCNS